MFTTEEGRVIFDAKCYAKSVALLPPPSNKYPIGMIMYVPYSGPLGLEMWVDTQIRSYFPQFVKLKFKLVIIGGVEEWEYVGYE